MKSINKNEEGGFTLMEMMITVVIIAILTAIAYPSYRDNVRRGDRSDARAALLENAQYMERFFTENSSYDKNVAGSDPVLPRTISPPNATGIQVKYEISIKSKAATTYTLQAVPKNGATTDYCKTLTINNLGQKSVDGTPTNGMTADTCWTK
ncbi:type IV pilin protein [Undibacterium sp. LX40W]|uniref:Type IV pilin protein n=1 Tax=Undibacterium nitidum TaxID=2762298 RepID=A0A923HW97_9BURK|nr:MULTISPECIES: type IV pilin protein [Undibacterium]MBC3882549.1 type IV pilin protein [Undibacterium nitidum]MBC3892830.1 type IV pilin protein [Undibacterium sp. LX40W]